MHVGLCVFFYPFYSLFSSTILMLFFTGSVHTTLNTIYFSFFLLPYNPKSNPSSYLSKPQNPDFLYDPLIHYPIANALWNMIFKLFGVMWVITEGVEDLLNSWKPGTEGWVDPKVMIQSKILHCLMWRLWRERSAQTFEGREKSVPDLKLILIRSLFEWMNASSLFSFDHMFEILDYCPFGAQLVCNLCTWSTLLILLKFYYL